MIQAGKFLILFLMTAITTFAQFKEDSKSNYSPMNDLLKPRTVKSASFFSNIFSAENFNMSHSFSMSYSAGGGAGLALGVYTNKMAFKIANNLDFSLNTSIVNAPYSTMGKEFNNSINGVYIDRAMINYRPTENMSIKVEFRQMPYNSYYSPYGRNSLNNYYNYPFDYE